MYNPVGRVKLGRFIVTTLDNPTYVLKYTPKTRTAIARAEGTGPVGPNAPYEIHVTTAEDPLVQATAKGWRTKSEDDCDLFVVEVKLGEQVSQFELPFAHAVFFADAAQ